MNWHEMTAATAAEAVANGIALLDVHGPEDWRSRIDIELVAFPSLTLCPLGQIYGSFGPGLKALRERIDADYDAVHFGFIHRDWSAAELALEWQTALSRSEATP